MPRGGKREGSGRKRKETTAITINISNALLNSLNKSYPSVKDRNNAIRKCLNKNFLNFLEKNN